MEADNPDTLAAKDAPQPPPSLFKRMMEKVVSVNGQRVKILSSAVF
jgi:hypothetical protein